MPDRPIAASEHDQPVQLIAFYLPQFHPVPENDAWWGPGFTEWRNVTRARPLFPGHYQPHEPADLGYYDLRLPETRAAQADLARAYGVDGFCYYHYWFGGRRLLHRPFDDVLGAGEPTLPFALCWANENWTRIWDGGPQHVLIGQEHSEADDLAHIRFLAEAFADRRYIRVGGRPLFLVYRASLLPDPPRTLDVWRKEAARLGVGELYLCKVEGFGADRERAPAEDGFDASVDWIPDWSTLGRPLRRNLAWRLLRRAGLTAMGYRRNNVFPYRDVVAAMQSRPEAHYRRHPCLTPSWDNSSRRREQAVIYLGADPELYQRWLAAEVERVAHRPGNDRLVFVNAWNEWAEGNHLEPDVKFGHRWLQATLEGKRSGIAAAQGRQS